MEQEGQNKPRKRQRRKFSITERNLTVSWLFDNIEDEFSTFVRGVEIFDDFLGRFRLSSNTQLQTAIVASISLACKFNDNNDDRTLIERLVDASDGAVLTRDLPVNFTSFSPQTRRLISTLFLGLGSSYRFKAKLGSQNYRTRG